MTPGERRKDPSISSSGPSHVKNCRSGAATATMKALISLTPRTAAYPHEARNASGEHPTTFHVPANALTDSGPDPKYMSTVAREAWRVSFRNSL
jgi:hypothetical protein